MKKSFLLLFLSAAIVASAQNKKQPVVYKKAISLSPLALADMDHTLMLTGEYRLHNKLALLVDAGYIFASEYFSQERKTWGYNIRPAIRMYYGKRNKGYLQAQAFHKSVTYTLHDWLGQNCVNGVPTYEKLQEFDFRKNVTGFHLTAGAVLPLTQSHKWLIDLYGGIGFRSKKHHLVNQPDACYNLVGTALFNFQMDDVTTASLPLGVRITYVLE